jgi:hypothetical protein
MAEIEASPSSSATIHANESIAKFLEENVLEYRELAGLRRKVLSHNPSSRLGQLKNTSRDGPIRVAINSLRISDETPTWQLHEQPDSSII